MYFFLDDERQDQKEHSSGEPNADLVDDASLGEECKRLRDVIHTMSIENDALRVSNVTLAKQVTEREDDIEILLKKLTSQVNASTASPWVKDVIDSNVHMKLRLQMTERDNKDLADECLAMSRVIQKKTDQVHSLKQLVQSLQVQVEREGNFKDALEQKEARSAAHGLQLHQIVEMESIDSDKLTVEANEDNCTTSKQMLEVMCKVDHEEKKQSEDAIAMRNGQDDDKDELGVQGIVASIENVSLAEAEAEAEAEAAAEAEAEAAAEAEAEAAAAEAEAAEADNEDLRVEIRELKELVDFLEMERMCSMEEEKANAAEKSNDQIDKITLLVKENAILKEQVEARREGFALKISKETKLLVQLNAKKDVCAKLGRLAKRQQTKRKAIERKCSKMAKSPKTTTKLASPKMNTEPRVSLTNVAALNGMSATKEIVTNSLKQDDNCKHEELELANAINDLKLKRQIEDLEERNQELAELVEFLELERKCTLEENEEIRISDCQAAEKEIERIRISMKSNYDKLINDYEEEKQRRMHFEKLLEQMEAKLQGTKERFDNEFQKNLELETKLMKMEEAAAENSSKPSLNCLQRIFRRRRR